ncbi:hypothetical protein NB640_11850 [Oxalobacter vibrioformis]|uniref:Lipoprotein n=1 Tax=Oxalobacter vibrioformis TaxID=933080 RepID=A0A9E9LX75_9BURK|nr:hypothetical protein [Oxalobacter vibrioformis]WAW09896.1 hypothetical protein NB640_11850 [Oxalobacter vibrioformis]
MKKKSFLALLATVLLASCVTIPPNTFVVDQTQLEQRQAETRRYDGMEEEAILQASANVLQDLGYAMGDSELRLGILTGSKERDATDGGEIAVSIFVALLTGAATPVSQDQTINVLLVVRPVLDSNGKAVKNSHYVRVSFQRIVRLTNGATRVQTLKDPELYQEFHDKLSKSVFIEGQKI